MGLLTGLLPPPQGLPPNITPNQGGLQNFGGRVMQNLPYGGGLLYDAINSLVHGAQGTLGQHGPAPDIFGRAFQYINPGFTQNPSGYAANPQGPVDPSDPSNPLNDGITFGNVQQPGGMASPFLPTNSETNNPPMYGGQQQAPANQFGGYSPQQSFSPIASFNSYIQGTQGGYGGSSPLQLMQALRGLPIDQNVQAAIGANSYSAPWDLAAAIGAYQGGGGGNQGPYGASPNFRQA